MENHQLTEKQTLYFNSLVSILRIHKMNEAPRPVGSGFFILYKNKIYYIMTLHNFIKANIRVDEIKTNKENLFIENPVTQLEISAKYYDEIFISEELRDKEGACIDENDFLIIKISDLITKEIKNKISYFNLDSKLKDLDLNYAFEQIINRKYDSNYCIGFPVNHQDYDYDYDEENKSIKLTVALETLKGILEKDNENEYLFYLTNIKYDKNRAYLNKPTYELNGFSGSPIFTIINNDFDNFLLLGMLLRANGLSVNIKKIIKFIDENIKNTYYIRQDIDKDTFLTVKIQFNEESK